MKNTNSRWAGWLTSWLVRYCCCTIPLYIREETDTVGKIIKMRFMNFWVIIFIYGLIYSLSVLLYL